MFKRFLIMMTRAMARRCPYCGQPGIFDGWFNLRERCPQCGLHFERDEGYWTGAMGANIIVTELVFAVVLVTGIVLTWPDIPMWPLLIIGLILNATFPIFFYPFSKTSWMAFDLLFRPLEEHELRSMKQ